MVPNKVPPNAWELPTDNSPCCTTALHAKTLTPERWSWKLRALVKPTKKPPVIVAGISSSPSTLKVRLAGIERWPLMMEDQKPGNVATSPLRVSMLELVSIVPAFNVSGPIVVSPYNCNRPDEL